MTIRTKLTLNVIILLLIVAGVATSSIIGMTFVKNRLHDLTQRSTPFQMRTVEFQRQIQGATADLIKVGTSRNRGDFSAARREAEQTLAEVQRGQALLQELSGETKVEAYGELNGIAAELFAVTQGRIRADEEAVAANKTIMEKVRGTTVRLKELDAKIRGLQSSTSSTYARSMGETGKVSAKVANITALKLTLKDFQLGFLELAKAQSKKGVLISQGKCNSAMKKALENELLKTAPVIAADLKLINAKLPAFIKAQNAVVGQPGADTAARDQLVSEISEKVSAINLAVEQEGTGASDNLSVENRKQTALFGSSNLATGVMAANSELLSLGLNVEGLASKLFVAPGAKELSALEEELRRAFARADAVERELGAALTRLGARREIGLLRTAEGELAAVRALLSGPDGMAAKVRNRLQMEEKAAAALVKLRETVQKQAERGRQTVSVAQSAQEKAIVTVNRMVIMSTWLIGAIGIAAAIFGTLFGIWVYHSIARPLAQLLLVSQAVAKGDLSEEIDAGKTDEIGAVQVAMAEMVHNLREMVAKIKGATDSLASSSEELSATAVSLERGSEEQTSRIDQSATAMTEMTETTVEVARNSTDTSDAALRMKELAEQGKEAMQVAVQDLQRFAVSVKEAAGQVESLGEKSAEVTELVILINDIAEQTNLLALNAAIEAARAGDQGRGFAVVADNVRQLAERTALATKHIDETVQAMQKSVGSSVSLMQEERHSVDRVQERVQQTLAVIGEIVAYVERVTDMVQRIAVATEEQSSTSADVARHVDEIFTIARELRSSFADIRDSSENLSRLALELDGMVGWFKVQ